MKSFFKAVLILLTLVCVLCGFSFSASAEETVGCDISSDTVITGSGYSSFAFLKDGNIKSYQTASGGAVITLENPQGIGGLYLIFDLEFGAYTITDNSTGQTCTAGEGGFLHEYVDIFSAFGAAPTSVTLDFSGGSVRLSEIYTLSTGTPPDFVQTWGTPLDGGADLVLFATHGDDDQLFFAGLLPYYAGELGYRVQVVYLTNHRTGPYATNARTHEMLNGLWNVGVTTYPVFGTFEDIYTEDIQATYDIYLHSYNTTEKDLLSFVVEQIRRFRPLVAVGHDLAGEYSHGMHMVYSDLLVKALEVSGDVSVFPESAEQYGVWDIPKLYLHLYEENTITLDYDQPLEAFDGMTAFEVTQKLGYPCHESQQWTWFTGWINGKNGEITKASQIATYNPCLFGLYHSAVGEDVEKNDFFENITTYAEQERLEAERLEQERLEAERLEQERQEAERLEQERLEAERLEQERLEAERMEQERLASEQQAEQQKQERRLMIAGILLAVLIAALIGTLFVAGRKKRRSHRKK